jgi:hypothetical protein
MVKVQCHRLHHHLQLVHLGVYDQRMRSLWVLVVVFHIPGLVPYVGVIE